MRTTASIPALPRHVHWQAAFTTKSYAGQPSPPVVWRQVPACDAQAQKWSDGVLLTWATEKKAKMKSHFGPLEWLLSAWRSIARDPEA
jgi:hypothetical protein